MTSAYDKWITREPEDNFTPFVEQVIDRIPEETYNDNEDWFNDSNGTCNKWLNKLYDKKYNYEHGMNAQDINNIYEHCAMILERAFLIYIKQPQTK